ncbi:MAG: hercynine metabolism small protein [Parasynechococcus sp.]|jgi:hercynine metabolism small protein|tara:strand:+ start:110 stop:340 length:231 start_codon:yes stop_codon:yes gene_type:complete
MGLEQRRETIRAQRQQLIDELEALYMAAFERIGQLEMGEGAVARLTQLMLRSREAAITPLQEEIEKPVITTPGNNP